MNGRNGRLVWYGLLAVTSGVFVLAMLPPVLPASLQGVVREGFAPVCHQLLGPYSRYALLGALVPLGLDWMGPLLSLWGNGPVSRALTGLLFGSVAASYVTAQLLHRKARTSGTGGPE